VVVDSMMVRGARAALSAHGEQRKVVMWTDASGSIAAAEGEPGWIAIGPGRDDPFAITQASRIETWSRSGARRPVAAFGGAWRVHIGVGGAGLLVASGHSARLVPLPQDAKSAVPTLDGWRDLAVPGDAILRACGAHDGGIALMYSTGMGGFTLGAFRPDLAATIDGSPRRVQDLLYDLRVALPPAGAPARLAGCVAKMAVALAGSGTPTGVEAVRVVYVDLVKGRAEGADAAASVSWPMTCTLADR
jgi:hypothetical protein